MAFAIAGEVLEAGSPVARTVRAYLRSSGALVQGVTSASVDGVFVFPSVTNAEHYIVALDDTAAGDDFNALIYDRVVPVSINTIALLHFNGADASTTFTDVFGKTWTANGNAQIDTAQSVFGGASGLFDGTGDYITTPDHADFSLGTADFCVEFFFRPASLGSRGVICGQANSTGTSDFSFFIEKSAADKLRAQAFFAASNVALVGATSVVADTWYHGAFTRSGSDFRLFLNGTLDASASSALAIVNSTTQFCIGRAGDLDSLYYHGWIDEFRMKNGSAIYTGNFTPPAVPHRL